MKRTNVFATDEEKKQIKELVSTAQSTPMIALSSDAAISGRDFSSLAWKSAHEKIHATAMSHGLPDTQGWYGIDLANGEFLSMEES